MLALMGMRTRLTGWLQVRPGEEMRTGFLFGVFFFTSAGSALGSNAIDALLFARFGVRYLPGLFIALGAITVLVTLGVTALLGRGARERLYVRIALALAAVLIVARLALLTSFPGVYPVVWLAMNVGNSLQGILTWGLAGAALDARQARRLFPLVGAGAILGSVAGGLLTRPAAALAHSENLVLAWALALVLAFACGVLLLRRGGPATPPRKVSLLAETTRGFRTVRQSSMLRWLSAAVILFALLYASLQFVFAQTVTQAYPSADSLAGFLGLFQGLTTGVAFLASVFLANRLFARVGLMNSVLTFAVVYLAVFAALSVSRGFWVVVPGRFLSLLYLYGLAGSAYHALFNVLPGERRDQARTFLDGVPAQFGTALAGLLLLLLQARPPAYVDAVGVVGAALLVASLLMARRNYGAALLAALRAGRPVIFAAATSAVDQPGAELAEAKAIERALDDPRIEDETLLRLERSQVLPSGLRPYAESQRDRSLRYHRLAAGLPADGDIAQNLLRRSVEIRARRHALRALRAAGLLSGRSLSIAVEGVEGRDPELRAMALEMLDSLGEPGIVKPLMVVFEAQPLGAPVRPESVLAELAHDNDPWVRDCARLASGVQLPAMETAGRVPILERVAALSRVPLFEGLDPADLRQVAEVASEHVFRDAEEVVRQGDPGDELYVVLSGDLDVLVDGKKVATRGAGDHVGEMAVLTREPRIATVIARGEVRALGLRQPQFEAMLRERPEIALAVIATLRRRLQERDLATAGAR